MPRERFITITLKTKTEQLAPSTKKLGFLMSGECESLSRGAIAECKTDCCEALEARAPRATRDVLARTHAFYTRVGCVARPVC